MGLYDHITVKMPLPGKKPDFVKNPTEHQYQTKDLDCAMLDYVIDEPGWLRDSNGVVTDDTVDIDFYDSNSVASAYGMLFTRNGEDYESVEYRAQVVNGMVRSIEQTEYTREPALPYSECNTKDKPSAKMAQWKERQAEDLVGRNMYLLYGGSDSGTDVKVVACGTKEWCVRDAKGSLHTIHRFQRDVILFDSEEDAFTDKAERAAALIAEKVRLENLMAERKAHGQEA